ncbi:hypothetical protein CVT24_012161 [Panaeolus cyanescens]|uniref:Uncharacterized protein n=1 Tax=Panaeolus cyanescens TaxID=181874 RepID=A0A409YIT8_9AGAR|nr:hypothetical protein CVT24_012161 [Panaeolus cyanescens]
MECNSPDCPFKKSLSTSSRRDDSIISSATHKVLLQNHNEAYTQLCMDNLRLQTRYDMLWECYQSLVQRIIFEHSSPLPKVFDNTLLIPEVVPDSLPSSPYPGSIRRVKNTPNTPSFHPHQSTSELYNTKQPLMSSTASIHTTITADSLDEEDPDWTLFTRAYEDRRRINFNMRSEVDRHSSTAIAHAHRLEQFFDEMDHKYPYN